MKTSQLPRVIILIALPISQNDSGNMPNICQVPTIDYLTANSQRVTNNLTGFKLLNSSFIPVLKNEPPINESRLPRLNSNVERTLFNIKIDSSTVKTKLES